MTALIFDSETTGLKEPVIIEAAWLALSDPLNLTIQAQFEQRYNPGKAIELGALSTHHIMDEELADCQPASEFALPEDTEYLIGHNVDYDWRVIGEPPIKRICTLALSRRLFPALDSHTQSAMIYHFERDDARQMLKGAHSALADVKNCRVVLDYLVSNLFSSGRLNEASTWADLWAISEQARIPTLITFGKHKGELISAIPADYKQWLLRQSDVDPYLAKALHGGKLA